MSDMDKQRKLVLYKSPAYRVRISPSTLLSLSLSSFSSFSPSTSSDDILISKALNMASLRSYGSHSSLPSTTSQVAPSAPDSTNRHSMAYTFGTDNDTESQHIIRERLSLSERINSLSTRSSARFDAIEGTLHAQGEVLDEHSTKLTSLEKTLDEHSTKLTSLENTLDEHTAKFISIDERLASLEKSSRSQHEDLQKQLSKLTDTVEALIRSLKMGIPVDQSQFPQILNDTANAATQLIPQISRSSPPLEPLEFARESIRTSSDSPSPGPSTRRYADADRVDFSVNRSEVDLHQLLSEARPDANPEMKHGVKGILQGLKTVLGSVSSKSLKSSKSVKSFKSMPSHQ